jgi:hypothetical protein
MESALLRLEARAEAEADAGMRALAPPIWTPSPGPIPAHLLRTPMYGTPKASIRPRSVPPAEDPDLAIPLTRRNFGTPPVPNVSLDGASVASTPVEIGPPAIERTTRRGDSDPVLDLKRRKPAAAAPAQIDPEYAPASTVRGPFAPSRTLPPPSLAPPLTPSLAPPAAPGDEVAIVDRMRDAHERDQILDLLVAGAREVARSVVVLAVRRDALVGWTGSGEVADRAALRAVRLPNSRPTVLHDSLEREGARPAHIPVDAAHAPLLVVLHSPPRPGEDVIVAAVQAEGRPVALVLALGLGEAAAIAVEHLAVLARAGGEALGRLLRERRG